MRYATVLFLFALSAGLPAQTNVALRSITNFPGQHLANIWGYASGGNEYALVGGANGLIIMNVTDPDNPVQICQMFGPSSTWREIKTYSHYAYVVTEGGLGVQIVDLSSLPNPPTVYQHFFGNGGGSGLNKAHALHIDETMGFLYLYGTNLYGGRPVVFNLNPDPFNPTYVNYVNFGNGNDGYVHDGYADSDMLYTANLFGGYFAVINMTNKANPVQLATQPTPGLFTHNTWRNGNYLYTTDETSGSFLSAYDISNPGNITLVDKIQSNPGLGSVVHNTYTLNDFAITAWYKDGFTIVDVARPANMVQVGDYDTYAGIGNGFEGCWGVYPYLPSGNILASIIREQGTENGQLYICTPTYERACYLEGQITAAATGNPINGAVVNIVSSGVQESSAATGLYKMGLLQSGTYTVQVSKAGYQTFFTSVTLSNGVLTTLDVALLLPGQLPVELTNFSVRADKREALLHWETASEINNTGFEIQQSSDGFQWQRVGFVAAKGPSEYNFRVENLSPGTWYFRLRQLDRDGAETFSDAQSVVIQGAGLTAQLFPNMVKDHCRLRLNSESATSVQVDIFDAKLQPTGLSWRMDVEGVVELPISVGHLAAGTYYVVVGDGREKVTVVLVKG